MSAKVIRAFLATTTLATLCATWGCVADRPSRNGVFNENQYVRKSFLVRPGDAPGPDVKVDNGWHLKATITSTTTPNPLAPMNLFVGSENGGSFVRFDVTSDKLRMLNMREIGYSDPKQATREPEAVNVWPITNVDLKYRVNLDGEKTNFYEENQELDWQVRQWVKINFAKNDLSDLAPYGEFARYTLDTCTDIGNASTTLVPNSLVVDEKNDYLQWSVNITLPIKFDNPACVQQYGTDGVNFQRLGRSSVNMTVMYSMVRAIDLTTVKAEEAYVPLEIQEKDPIRRKYGTIDFMPIARDPETGLLGARELAFRYNPKKPILWIFAPGYPENYKLHFTGPNGIVEQTNKLMEDAGAAARVSVLNYDDEKTLGDGLLKGDRDDNKPRQFGDIRYSFIRWESDLDTGSPFLAVTQFAPDYRTGEIISSSINVADFAMLDRVKARLDFYLESIGAVSDTGPDGEWLDGPANCKDGDVIPLVPFDKDPAKATLASRNSHSTLYAKMQDYLQKPVAKFGNLSPADFVVPQDQDFMTAYFALAPYQVYRDPATNAFVTPEGVDAAYGPEAQLAAAAKEREFHKLAASLDQGISPFNVLGAQGLQEANKFSDNFKDLTLNHRDLNYMKNFNHGQAFYDEPGMIQFIDAFAKNARHCVDGKWETKAEYVAKMTDSYHSLTVWHEFGHTLGLDHNFMASVDRNNFPHYKDGTGRDHIGMYQSSVMEYNAAPDRVFWKTSSGGPGWGPYDQGAISFIYGNDKAATDQDARGDSFSGQAGKDKSGKAVMPAWKDVHGFTADGKTEIQYLYCSANHLKYTPFCRQFDFGSTPSEIVAADIDNYEWQYKWRNFRLYRKFADFSAYVDAPAALITDMRRFISQWQFDWSGGEIQDTLRRIGIAPPPNVPQAAYYGQLTDKFNRDISMANQMVAAFHKAVIQQSSGERPFKTVYDNYYGDVTQQGILLDKLLALQSWVDIWRVDNFDPDQAQGAYQASYDANFGDAAYEGVAEDAVDSMVGGQYDIFPFGKPLAVSMFAKATHDINFTGRIDTRDRIGGHVFGREQDFLDYFRGIAVAKNTYGCNDGTPEDTLATCKYDPRPRQFDAADIGHSNDYNEFTGPDSRRYAWLYMQDRNVWVIVDRDRNTASYVIVRNYNNLVIRGESDDQRPFDIQLQVKYFLDAYFQYN